MKATWKLVNCKDSSTPPSRQGHTATLIPTTSYIVVYGGQSAGVLYNDVHILDVENMKWTKIDTSGDAPCPRYQHSAVYLPLDHSIYIYGGYANRLVHTSIPICL